MVQRDANRNCLERGRALFNAGRFFECHEVWEMAWTRSHGVEKTLYQGLIQSAVAILHAERGNLRGAESVYRKARVKLDALPARCMEIEVGEFRRAMEEFFARMRRSRQLPDRPRIERCD